jgi:phospholipid/cholesterol/gamma-HCH transport system substrate-binding protein
VITAIRKYLPQFAAIAALVALAAATSYVIFQEQRLRIPVLEEKPFELKAEIETAQAVEPGQGQTIRVAGVRIGDVADVELSGGVAEVSFAIDREYLPIYRDATILMRPQTGLKDMFFELDPGSRAAGAYEDGETIPVSNTLPDVNLEEVLAALDTDSRAYLRLLAVGLGSGLEGRGAALGGSLGRLGPIARDLEQVNGALAARDEELARLVHNANLLSGAVAGREEDLEDLVVASDSALGALAAEAPDLRAATGALPGTLATARRSLRAAEPLAAQLGPTLGALRPFARRLDEVAGAAERLAGRATPVLRDEIRPLVRAARPVVPDLRKGARRLADAAPKLEAVGHQVNRLGNMAAYNPRGSEPPGTEGRDEGYLYWLGWFAHNGTSVFTGQDAHGVYRRLYLTGSCQNLLGVLQAAGPAGSAIVGGIISGLGPLFAPGGACEA